MLARICDCCGVVIKGIVWNMTITNTESKQSADWDLCSECHNRINATIDQLSAPTRKKIYGVGTTISNTEGESNNDK